MLFANSLLEPIVLPYCGYKHLKWKLSLSQATDYFDCLSIFFAEIINEINVNGLPLLINLKMIVNKNLPSIIFFSEENLTLFESREGDLKI